MNAIIQPPRITLEPQTFDELVRFSAMAAKSTMVPKDYVGKPENVFIAAQWGREIGLGVLQSMQNIAVINGRPSLWGDAMMALVRGSGICEYIVETTAGEGDAIVATCRTKRKDDPNEIVRTFSVDDAKKAGLSGKVGPWTQYRSRMLQLRARGFALRDGFADVLRGVISAEEARDMPPDPIRSAYAGVTIDGETPSEPKPQGPTRKAWLDALEPELEAAQTSEAVDAILARDDVQKAQDRFGNGHKERLDTMVNAAIQRTTVVDDDQGGEMMT